MLKQASTCQKHPQRSCYKLQKNPVFFPVLLCLSFFLSCYPLSGYAHEKSPKFSEETGQDAGESKTVAVKEIEEVPLSEEDAEKAEQGYIRQAWELREKGAYDEAEETLIKARDLDSGADRDPWLVHLRLADIYEVRAEKDKFLGEMKWLIGAAQNEGAKQSLIARRNQFLRQYPD